MTSETVSRSSSAGELVRTARERSRISQRELARRAGTSQAAISRIERGLEQPTIERLEQILAGLGWRPVIDLEPIAVHDDEPRRMRAAADTDPDTNLQSAINLARVARELMEAGAREGG
jgi:transcriptional regulator with XRE-family HTH domain